jgi:hypothetical protein
MSVKAEYSPERLAARAEITDVMYRWCRAVDRRDWAAIYEAFHSDGHDNHGLYKGDVDGLIAWLSERHETISRSMHLVGNMLIEFADDDNAMVESYTLAVQRYNPGGSETRKAIAGGVDLGEASFDMLIVGRYVDHFQRRNGAWRVLRRTVIFDNSQMLPVPAEGPRMGPEWSISARDGSDPLWSMRREFGLA